MERSVLERVLYALSSYEIADGKLVRILGKRIIPSGIIFTMNSDEQYYKMGGYDVSLGMTRDNLEHVLGYAEQYNSYNTLQFADYSKMDANYFDPEAKKIQHKRQFPIDQEKCYEMGKHLVEKAIQLNQ